MSELKEHLFVPYSELQEGDELTDAITIAKSYYLKSEADKVIEELKHQRDGAFGLTNSGLTLDDISQMARKQLDHHKYKRCMAMAKWCKDRIENVVQYNEHDDWLIINEYWERWRKRWLNIAKQFKEGRK